jgi:hypothetical protein
MYKSQSAAGSLSSHAPGTYVPDSVGSYRFTSTAVEKACSSAVAAVTMDCDLPKL